MPRDCGSSVSLIALDRGGVSSPRWKRESEGIEQGPGFPGAGRGTGVNVRTFAWMLFNVNEVGPNVNGIILLSGLFVSVSVFNTLTLLVDNRLRFHSCLIQLPSDPSEFNFPKNSHFWES